MLKARLQKLRQDRNLMSLFKNSGQLYVAGVFSIGITFVQQITTASFLGPDVYGLFATLLSSTAFTLLIFDFRTWEASAKLLSQNFAKNEQEEAASVITWLLLLDIIAGILACISLMLLNAWVATSFLKNSDLGYLVMYFAIAIPFQLISLGVPPTIIRLSGRFDLLSAKSILYALVRLLLISGAAFMGWGLQGVVLGAIISEVLQTIILLLIVFWIWSKEKKWFPLFRLQAPKNLGEHLKLIRELWIGASIKGLQLESFIPMLALLTNSYEVGVYKIAQDIANLLLRLISPFSLVIQPSLFQIYEEQGIKDFVRYIKQSSLLLAAFVLPFVLGIILIGPFVLPSLLEEYVGITAVVSVLVVGVGVSSLVIWLRPALVAQNAIRQQNVIGIIGFLLLMLGLFLFSRYGALGAAFVMTTFYVLYSLASLVLFFSQLEKSKNEGS